MPTATKRELEREGTNWYFYLHQSAQTANSGQCIARTMEVLNRDSQPNLRVLKLHRKYFMCRNEQQNANFLAGKTRLVEAS